MSAIRINGAKLQRPKGFVLDRQQVDRPARGSSSMRRSRRDLADKYREWHLERGAHVGGRGSALSARISIFSLE